MSDNIISFRQAKKAISRAKKEQQATENKEKFGRKKLQKRRDKQDRDSFEKTVDGHKRDSSDPDRE